MQRRIIIVTCIVSLATSFTAQNLEKIWDFDSDKTGDIPEGFTNGVGEWKVIADPRYNISNRNQCRRLISKYSFPSSTIEGLPYFSIRPLLVE